MRIKILAAMMTVAAAAFAAEATPPPAAFADNAAPAKDIPAEYEFIQAHPCVCGGVLVPFDHYIDYRDDTILEIVLTRCPQCREDRTFYFDLTSRYGDLPTFRKSLLATRKEAAAAEDQPCATPATAVAVGGIPEEYIFLETTKHACGAYYRAGMQSLSAAEGHYYDVIEATCPADGAATAFYFIVDSFFGNMDGYPELAHGKYGGEPPEALPGRRIETAYDAADNAGRAQLLEDATHAADGGKLVLVNGWTGDVNGVIYGVADTTCAACGSPVRLYFKLPADAAAKTE